MSSARSATAAPRTARTSRAAPARPRRVSVRAPAAGKRIRWDRVGRTGLLVVLAVVAALYVKQGLALLSTKSQADQQLTIVHKLAHENAALERQKQSLGDPATIERAARQLGMVRPGERPYVITGLPGVTNH